MTHYYDIHKKLVRDEIPRIIEENGENVDVRILEDDEEFFVELCRKLREESRELVAASSREEKLEEFADLMEVISVITDQLPFTNDEIREAVSKKRKARGGFEQRIFLERTSHEQKPGRSQNDTEEVQ